MKIFWTLSNLQLQPISLDYACKGMEKKIKTICEELFFIHRWRAKHAEKFVNVVYTSFCSLVNFSET
jgi:DNA-directed RNA polymerase subunit F